MPPTSAWRFIEAVLVSPSLGILTETERHQGILGALLQRMPTIRGNLVFDAHNVALMQEHGVRAIYTHDADLRRFPGVEVIDPL
jgi:predicted nucleic acid-binding protein